MINSPSPILSKIAYYQNQRDEVPNQLLARELAETRNTAGLMEIAAHLWDKNKNIQSDCLKVLYETGYIDPHLIADFTGEFLKLLHSKNNRMVWGAMIGLGCVADLRPDNVWAQIDDVFKVIETGSVITLVWGVKALAKVAASRVDRRERIFPFLVQILKTCIPRDVPTHAGNMLVAIDESIKVEFLSILEARHTEMTSSQLSRLKKVIKAIP
jgi:hypothetical protein